MKIFKFIIIVLALGFTVSSCDLTEHPTFLSQESAYDGITNMRASLDGIYNGMVQYSYYGSDYIYSSYGASGFFVSGKGNSNTHPDNQYLCSLKPLPNGVYTEKPWGAMYIPIERANNFIKFVNEISDPKTSDELSQNDFLGEAYFLRAFTYFDLVQMYGEVPLRLEPAGPDNIHMPKASTSEIYAQIIEDAKNAERLMFHTPFNRKGYPAAEAASMLLAKVYMAMATTDDAVPINDPQEAWQKAYEYAKKVYGKYTLNNDYNAIFEDATSDNTGESIFELQFNDVVHSNYGKLFTASKAIKGKSWGRIRANAELIDQFSNCYPNDSIRYHSTFKTSYIKYGTTKKIKIYPEVNKRNKFASSFPYIYKYWVKDRESMTSINMRNKVVYRYADLLLMLAEISNELQNGEQEGYVNEVLARVGLTIDDFVPDTNLGADYKGGQDGFRKAIMLEYRFELLGEGQDYYNNKRRGFNFFKEMVIDPHNNYDKFNPDVDVTLADDKDVVMHFPIPQSEINTNDEIDN